MTKILKTDTLKDVLVKMADGNPGAISTLMGMLSHDKGPGSAPSAAGVVAISLLDKWEIYGSSIYVLFSDKCERNTAKLLVLIHATELGIFDLEKLQRMAADQMRQVNVSHEEWAELHLAVLAKAFSTDSLVPKAENG